MVNIMNNQKTVKFKIEDYHYYTKELYEQLDITPNINIKTEWITELLKNNRFKIKNLKS